MVQGIFVQFSAFEGPSTRAPYAAAVAELSVPTRAGLPVDRVRALLDEFVPESLARLVVLDSDPVTFVDLAARVASALQDLQGACELPVDVDQTPTGKWRILLGYHDVQTALHALRGGLEIAKALFGRVVGSPDPRQTIAALVERIATVMLQRQPDAIARALIRVARTRGLPVYPLAPGSRIWQYGQGSAAMHFVEAANHRDSLTGARLAADKFMTNQLIRRLGLPGVEHEIVRDAESARRAAEQFGFPLVVKPVNDGKGRGVTANIRTPEAFETAYARAARSSRRGVLVERFVEGDDHRLSVFGGRLAFASRRSPPRVTCDGVHTLAELIDLENGRRSDADVAAGFLSRLLIDGDLQNTLAGQGLGLGDRPEPGRVVALRTIANVATGGTVTDCTAVVHPDNRALAETIARAFHMDALGIDFMTPDISQSWREVPCAVLEINATPGFSSDARAALIVEAQFPGGSNGRIPSVVLVDAEWTALEAFAEALRAAGLRVGATDGRLTQLEQRARCGPAEHLPARVLALLLDPGCEALVIGASVGEIERHGFPLDRCDLAVVATQGEPEAPVERLLRACSARVVRCAPGSSPAGLAAAAVAQLLEGRTPGRSR